MTLEEDLQTIDGVGPKTAAKAAAIVAEQTQPEPRDHVHKALTFLERGQPRIAQDVLESALSE